MAYVSRTVSASRIREMAPATWEALRADLSHEDRYGLLSTPTAAIDTTAPSGSHDRIVEDWQIGWASMDRAPIGELIEQPSTLPPVRPTDLAYANEETRITRK